jgi:hypothetical protein
VLVGAALVEVQAVRKERVALALDAHARVAFEAGEQSRNMAAKRHRGQAVGDFEQDPASGDDQAVKGLEPVRGAAMVLITRIEQCEVEPRIGKHGFHFSRLGVP